MKSTFSRKKYRNTFSRNFSFFAILHYRVHDLRVSKVKCEPYFRDFRVFVFFVLGFLVVIALVTPAF